MKVRFYEDPQAMEPYVLVCARVRDAEIEALMERIAVPKTLAAHSERGEIILKQAEIQRIYTQQRQVLAQSDCGIFPLKERLYALEAKLDPHEFVRISNSEIVNRRRILKLDFSLTGTIRLIFRDGTETYVSRRYVAKIRSMFDKGGK